MANFIVQIYKTIQDYQNNLYTSFSNNPTRKIYPLIVTLEDWYLFAYMLKDIDSAVMEKLNTLGISPLILKEMPYQLCSIEDFEKILSLIRLKGIGVFMDGKITQKEWSFKTYIANNFKSDIDRSKYIFNDDFKALVQLFKTTSTSSCTLRPSPQAAGLR